MAYAATNQFNADLQYLQEKYELLHLSVMQGIYDDFIHVLITLDNGLEYTLRIANKAIKSDYQLLKLIEKGIKKHYVVQ